MNPELTTRKMVTRMLLVIGLPIAVVITLIIITFATSSTVEEVANDDTGSPSRLPYTLNDTGQKGCYDNASSIACPTAGEDFYGQDAQYVGNKMQFVDNGNGTVTDLNTGLTWSQEPGEKVSFADALADASSLELGDYDDWRLPNIKELYSLIDFTGASTDDSRTSYPYIDDDIFGFEYGDENYDDRLIDSQFWSSTEYVGQTMDDQDTVFGVNFADGRIKGYPKYDPTQASAKLMFARFVRGDIYGSNDLELLDDGVIADLNTGLQWMQRDSGHLQAGEDEDGNLGWQESLAWCENLDYGGYTDWRLPNAKELQSIVDYSRSLQTTDSAAINALFSSTPIIDEGGNTNYAFYWTSTSHLEGLKADSAVYIAFGEALGFMQLGDSDEYTLLDVHGAGAQRSNLKVGDVADYPNGFGPQGDVMRFENMARCVREGVTGMSNGKLDSRIETVDETATTSESAPDVAVEACGGKAEGDVCTFTGVASQINGTCGQVAGELACVP